MQVLIVRYMHLIQLFIDKIMRKQFLIYTQTYGMHQTVNS